MTGNDPAAGNDDVILSLTFISDDYIWYETTSGSIRILKKFENNKTSDDYGTNYTYAPSTGSYSISSWDISASLKDYVDSGKVGYYGGGSSSAGGSSSSLGNGITSLDITQERVPLVASGVKIPDAILIKDATTSTNFFNLVLTNIISGSHFAYETNNGEGIRWYIAFDVSDGSYKSMSGADDRVSKEFGSIQEYICLLYTSPSPRD